VSAINAYGESALSEIGGGALMVVVPDAPTNLQNVVAITLDDRIGVSFDEGVNNGGTSVIDYELYFDSGLNNDVYTLLATGLTEREYTATGLYSGTTYRFKAKARNSVGFSDLS
jgi:hypothetical protein